jgi:rSAM/selenodomain-associated transferase 2
MISIVSPVFNEEKALLKNYGSLKKLSRKAELIFVDGGSTDRSREIASRFGRVIMSEKGRARQMNHGAIEAKGDILLFLHADTIISHDALLSIEKAVKDDDCVGGCLTQRIDNASPIYRIIEAEGNLRARSTKVFYGDQGIFVRRGSFFSISGYPDVPIMEDVAFTKELRRIGRTAVLPDKIRVSARRWEKEGVATTIFLHLLMNILSWLRVPLDKIKLLYGDLR